MVIFIAKLFYIQKLAAVPCAYCNKSPLEYQAPALAGAQATGQGKDHVVGVVLLCLLVDTCCDASNKTHPKILPRNCLLWMGQ